MYKPKTEAIVKRVVFLLLIGVQTIVSFSATQPETLKPFQFFQPWQPELPLQVMVHRGAMSGAPENTKPALELAHRLGYEWIEVDVRLTKDGHHVLFHNGDLDGKTNGSGPVRSFPRNVLKKLDAGSWFGLPYKDERIPTFEEAVQVLKKHGTGLYLDNKDTDPKVLMDALHKLDYVDKTVIYGGIGELAALKDLDQSIKVMPPMPSLEKIDAVNERLHPYAFDTRWESLSPEPIGRCHELGIRVFSDSVGEHDHLAVFQKAIGWKIDLIQSNYPTLVQRAVINSMN